MVITKIIDRYNWSCTYAVDVRNEEGKTGTRYHIEPNIPSASNAKEKLIDDMQSFFGKEKVIIGTAIYKFAPEIKKLSIIILN